MIETREDDDFLKDQIITCIGNKRKLLPFIGEALNVVKKDLNVDKLRLADMFSGSGIVSRYFKQHASHIIANDLETYSAVSNRCYLTNISDVDEKKLKDLVEDLHRQVIDNLGPGFITMLYSPVNEQEIRSTDRVFYTRRNSLYIDTARQLLETVDPEVKDLLLGPLLSQASVHVNTSGVFKGFHKDGQGLGQFGGKEKNALGRILGDIRLLPPVLSRFECSHEVHQQDANRLVGMMDEVDVAYLDPPYNQHPYGSNYFMLNLIADYQEPSSISKVSGIPVGWNRSEYNDSSKAYDTLLELIVRCPARYLLISYNSEGFIDHERFTADLKLLGRLTIEKIDYPTYRGSRNLSSRNLNLTEFLYLLKKG